jgi:hypothetical protein
MDKAKKMAEQAQAKLDEKQKQFNQGQGSGSAPPAGGAPPVQYDSAGRPIPQEAPPAGVTPPHGDPLGGGAAPASPPPPAPPAPPAPPSPPAPAAGPDEDRNNPSTEPPKMSSGDPLAG